jgi:MerR family copper efflux transcriptional regulator
MGDAEPARAIKIGEVAERTGLSLNTLRHYDEVGLVAPSARSGGGFRLYSEEDVERLLLIRRMKPLGFSVEEMRDLLVTVDSLEQASGDEKEKLLAHVRDFAATARQRRDKLARQLAMADDFIEVLRAHGAG